jgi:hypothetical protein
MKNKELGQATLPDPELAQLDADWFLAMPHDHETAHQWEPQGQEGGLARALISN